MSFSKSVLGKFDSDISIDSFPMLPCPACGKSTLGLLADELLLKQMKNQYSTDDFEKIDFDENLLLGAVAVLLKAIDNVQYMQSRFSGFLMCEECGDVVSVVGKAKVPSPHALRTNPYLKVMLRPEFFSPAIPLMKLSDDYPRTVNAELVKSFSTFFSDASQSGGRVRLAIEMLMDDVGVEKFRLDKSGNIKVSASGKEIKLGLNERLSMFGEENPNLTEMLFAIKAVGNEAAHNSGLERADLSAAYDVLGYVLDELYVRSKVRNELLRTSGSLSKKYN